MYNTREEKIVLIASTLIPTCTLEGECSLSSRDSISNVVVIWDTAIITIPNTTIGKRKWRV